MSPPRPDLAVAMYHRWRSLLFVHWAVEPEIVRRSIPASLDVDTFEGKAWIGLVPFTMPYVRPRGLPRIPTADAFHETNVRAYVRWKGEDPGVWFFSLDAASALAVIGARAGSPLLYHRANIEMARTGDDVSYRLERRWPPPTPATLNARWTIGGPRGEAPEGSREAFLVERYCLYAQRGRGPMVRMRVHHRSYPLEDARLDTLDETLTTAAGFPELHGTRPDSVLYSPGVDVEIFRPELLSLSGATRSRAG